MEWIAECRPEAKEGEHLGKEKKKDCHASRRGRALRESALHSQILNKEYDLWFEKERLISQIEQRVLKSLLPSLPKPWLVLGAASAASICTLGNPRVIDPSKKLLQIAGRGKARAICGEFESMPIRPQRIGSILLIMSLCPSFAFRHLLRESRRVLRQQGKLVIGFIPRQSLWARFYMRKKEHGHPFYRCVQFYSLEEVERMIMGAGFSLQGIFSSLFQKPAEVSTLENPMRGFRPQAGFLVMIGERMA